MSDYYALTSSNLLLKKSKLFHSFEIFYYEHAIRSVCIHDLKMECFTKSSFLIHSRNICLLR